MGKFSIDRATHLAKSSNFFEGLRLTHGSYAAAGRRMGIPAKYLHAQSKPSNAQIERLQRGLAKLSRGNLEVAEKYSIIRDRKITYGQIEYMKQQTAKGESQRRFFRKSIREAYEKSFRKVRYGAIDPATGKTFTTSPKTKKVRRGTRGKKRAIRRRGR